MFFCIGFISLLIQLQMCIEKCDIGFLILIKDLMFFYEINFIEKRNDYLQIVYISNIYVYCFFNVLIIMYLDVIII